MFDLLVRKAWESGDPGIIFIDRINRDNPNPDQGEASVELTFESRTPLEHVERRARDAGVKVAQPTSDEGFGRQLQLRTPDGLLVKVNEIDAELIG